MIHLYDVPKSVTVQLVADLTTNTEVLGRILISGMLVYCYTSINLGQI